MTNYSVVITCEKYKYPADCFTSASVPTILSHGSPCRRSPEAFGCLAGRKCIGDDLREAATTAWKAPSEGKLYILIKEFYVYVLMGNC